ncbi:MAG: D-tyrosyl-tRNA(Tyr) deacylase [Actinobacteria bacterium]|nr:D-tyrosyl-tRNA(Tyr) deacylase [Actinomycetota bacterium]
MRVVVQRVSSASVTVAAELVATIERGLLVLVGVGHDDTAKDAEALVDKIVGLRIFSQDGRMDLSVADVGGSVLVVSQFTLLGSVKKGRRPSFSDAASPEVAAPLVDVFMARVAWHGVAVAGGRFGAMMDVALVNDGPVTFVIDAIDGVVLR